jgi:protein-L-isoaspartate(D-aspartate) O-methyltransferase
MKTKSKICVSCLALVFMNVNYSYSQDLKEANYFNERRIMVEQQIKVRGICNKSVLNALMRVPRHKFVPEKYMIFSYDDRPLPIDYNQSISQPYIVAYMTEILNPDSSQKVLEIGTGSGYQAAILSLLYKEVYTVEIIEALGRKAKMVLDKEGYNNVKVKIGDGYQGWKEYAPFDAIIVTCAPTDIPQSLVDQLAEGGKMIIPVGEPHNQSLYLLEKKNGKVIKKATLPVLFVPMVREE